MVQSWYKRMFSDSNDPTQSQQGACIWQCVTVYCSMQIKAFCQHSVIQRLLSCCRLPKSGSEPLRLLDTDSLPLFHLPSCYFVKKHTILANTAIEGLATFKPCAHFQDGVGYRERTSFLSAP